MQKRPFGRTGLSVSPLGFGAAPIGYLEVEQKKVTEILNFLLDRGVNLIDTAAVYEASEEVIGEAVGHRRDEFVLVSKCGRQVEGVTGADWSAQLISGTIDRSLKRLRTDHLDVMLLHSCDLAVLEKGEAVAALARAQAAGKIRFAGYSGDNEAAAYAAGLPEIAVIETSINICDQANIDLVLPRARENNCGVLAKRPIANTAWRPLDQLKGLYREYARTYAERFHSMGLKAADLGFTSDADWPEIALRFALAQPGLSTAIIGTTSRENAENNLKAAEAGPLPAGVVDKIRDAFRLAERHAAETWEGLT